MMTKKVGSRKKRWSKSYLILDMYNRMLTQVVDSSYVSQWFHGCNLPSTWLIFYRIVTDLGKALIKLPSERVPLFFKLFGLHLEVCRFVLLVLQRVYQFVPFVQHRNHQLLEVGVIPELKVYSSGHSYSKLLFQAVFTIKDNLINGECSQLEQIWRANSADFSPNNSRTLSKFGLNQAKP